MSTETLDFDPDTFGSKAHEGDKRLHVRFHKEPVQDEAASEEAGRPIFNEETLVRIMVPGDKYSIVDRIATKEDKARFRTQYADFMAGNAQTVKGTPLAQWPLMTRSMAEEFKYFGIVTVEQLAELSDAAKQQINGGVLYSQKAKAFLEALNSSDRQGETIKEQQKQIDDLKAQMQAFMAQNVSVKIVDSLEPKAVEGKAK